MAALHETPLITPSVFPSVQKHNSRSLLDIIDLRSSQPTRPAKVEIQCQDRRQSVPLLDVTKSQSVPLLDVTKGQPKKNAVARNSAGMPLGEKSPLTQIRDIVPVDTALSVMTLSQSMSPVSAFERPENLDLHFDSSSPPLSSSELSGESPSSDGEKKRRRKRSPRAQRERRENKRTVYLHPLPPSLTETDVADLLSAFGRVQNVDWVGGARMACFARFESQVEAKKALEFGAPLAGNIVISSKKAQLQFIRAELGRLQDKHSALLEQLVPKRKQSMATDSEHKQQFNTGHRASLSPTTTKIKQQNNQHRRARSESVNTVLACDSSKNWRQSVSPRMVANNTRHHKFAAEDVRRHQRSMSELPPRASGPPRLNLKKPRKSLQCVRVAKGPDGSRGFTRHSH